MPLEIDFDTQIDIWLTFRSDAKRIARIRGTIDCLIQIYDPRRFPWFRDEFVHPARFAEIYKGKVLTSALATVRVTR